MLDEQPQEGGLIKLARAAMEKENEPINAKPDLEEIRQRFAGLRLMNGNIMVDKGANSSGVSSPSYHHHDDGSNKRPLGSAVGIAASRSSTVAASGAAASRIPTQHPPADTHELAQLTDEILVYCHLLDSSRKRALDDCMGLRLNIKELEKLLDSARQREVNHLSYVEQQREAMALFEKQYYSLKSRAKGLIRASQEEKDKIRSELEECKLRASNMETRLYSAQTLNDDQAKELERYREQSKNTPSEKELQEMRLTNLRLTDENGRLATERAALMDELKLQKKRGPSSANATASKENARKEEELEAAIQLLSKDNQDLKVALEASRSEVDELKAYVAVLMTNLEATQQRHDN